MIPALLASRRRWAMACSAASLLVAGGVWIASSALAPATNTGTPRAAIALGSGAAAFVILGLYGAVSRQLRSLRADVKKELRAMRQEQLSLTNVRPVIGSLPLNLSGWAVDPIFAEQLVFQLLERRPQLVVECGSGSSSVLIAATLKQLQCGYLLSLEHEARFAERTRAMEDGFGVNDHAQVLTAPLRPWHIGGEALSWYGFDPDRELRSRIDLLVVDGPPGPIAPRARYPAVPVLRPYLSEECVILMDDGRRPDEQWIARRWAAELGGDLEEMDVGRGIFIIRCGGDRSGLRTEQHAPSPVPLARGDVAPGRGAASPMPWSQGA
jgi:hypothetical protein